MPEDEELRVRIAKMLMADSDYWSTWDRATAPAKDAFLCRADDYIKEVRRGDA